MFLSRKFRNVSLRIGRQSTTKELRRVLLSVLALRQRLILTKLQLTKNRTLMRPQINIRNSKDGKTTCVMTPLIVASKVTIPNKVHWKRQALKKTHRLPTKTRKDRTLSRYVVVTLLTETTHLVPLARWEALRHIAVTALTLATRIYALVIALRRYVGLESYKAYSILLFRVQPDMTILVLRLILSLLPLKKWVPSREVLVPICTMGRLLEYRLLRRVTWDTRKCLLRNRE